MIRVSTFRPALFLLGVVLVTGCGSSGPPRSAKAAGQVTFNSQPVAEGEIYFVAAEKGYSAKSSLDAQGKYQVAAGLPPASYKVFITPPRITTPPMPGQAPPETKAFVVPDKYQTETTSGLTADVKAGDNKFDFPLN